MLLTRPLVALSLALVLGVQGCGDDDPETIAKSEFLAQGNAICAAGNLAVDSIGKSLDPNDEEQLLSAIEEQVVPLVRTQIEDLRELGYPEGDEELLEAMYDDTGEVLDAWADDPALAIDDERMAPINERLADYGLTECAS